MPWAWLKNTFFQQRDSYLIFSFFLRDRLTYSEQYGGHLGFLVVRKVGPTDMISDHLDELFVP